MLGQNFLVLDLSSGYFEGVFANEVLFRTPSKESPRILGELRRRVSRSSSEPWLASVWHKPMR